MASGGYRPPDKPAAVSGPGRLSQRTDTGPSDPNLGRQIAANQPTPPAPQRGRGPGDEMQQIRQQLFAPTQRPSEPITAGQQSPMIEDDPDELLRALYQNALQTGNSAIIGQLIEAMNRA